MMKYDEQELALLGTFLYRGLTLVFLLLIVFMLDRIGTMLVG